MNIFKRAWIRYVLHRHAIPHGLWLETAKNLAFLQGLTAVEKTRLRELSTLFLHGKHFVGAQGLELSPAMRVAIAAQACLPVLGLGFQYLSGWTDVIVYPSAFRVNRDLTDAAGVVHHEEQVLVGESWSRGPLIVSWAEVGQDASAHHPGHNVVIHEIAHKLDFLNGRMNGYPPLHAGMSIPKWTEALNNAYQHLVTRIEHHHHTGIDPYAASSPAEFFAVTSEYFFCAPETLHTDFPEVYQQLQLYYRQDPLLRQHKH
ncbi:M90 family metallopeptidase [Methylovulum miyakonense]|uniref:M90 family metallopeptidase n=1 Tax=Methylovulum miyakonense TaxID=645578 RepID=UPI00037C43E1|nr:M90 family metallopeptidase [Methylovulum miyakonense]